MKKITYVTGNKNKLEHFLRYADFPIEHIDLDLTEIQSLNVEEVVTHKAKEAFRIVQKPVLIEDVSLTCNALGKLPGPFIKWFLKSIGADGICRLLDNYHDRRAVAAITFALYDGKTLKLFQSDMHGTIAKNPQGDSFGWTPIFIPDGHTKSYGEMTHEEQHKVSMRRFAIEKLSAYFKENEK